MEIRIKYYQFDNPKEAIEHINYKARIIKNKLDNELYVSTSEIFEIIDSYLTLRWHTIFYTSHPLMKKFEHYKRQTYTLAKQWLFDVTGDMNIVDKTDFTIRYIANFDINEHIGN